MRTTIRLATLILLCTTPWPALAFEKNVLTVWIGQDKGFNGLAEIGHFCTAQCQHRDSPAAAELGARRAVVSKAARQRRSHLSVARAGVWSEERFTQSRVAV